MFEELATLRVAQTLYAKNLSALKQEFAKALRGLRGELETKVREKTVELCSAIGLAMRELHIGCIDEAGRVLAAALQVKP